MQNRKKQNREIERQIKQRKRFSAMIAVAIMLVLVLIIAFVVWDNQNRRWIMTFEGERIAVGDMLFYVQGQMWDASDRDYAYEHLVETLTVMNRAQRHNVGMTAEEIEEMESFIPFVMNEMEFITLRRSAELIGSWRYGEHLGGFGGMVRSRLMDIYAPSYTPDPVVFQENLLQHIENNFDRLADLQVKYIASSDINDVINAYMRISDEDDDTSFDDLIREFSEFHDEDEESEGIEPTNPWGFEQFFDPDDFGQVTTMQQGEFSPIVEGSGFYFIFHMYSREEADLIQVEADFMEHAVLEGRVGVFEEIVQGWVTEANYNLNQRVYNDLI